MLLCPLWVLFDLMRPPSYDMFYDQRQTKMRIESVRRQWHWSRSMRVRVQESVEVDRFRIDGERRRRTSAQTARACMYNVMRINTLHDPCSRSRSIQPHLEVMCCTRGKHIKKSSNKTKTLTAVNERSSERSDEMEASYTISRHLSLGCTWAYVISAIKCNHQVKSDDNPVSQE